jgi:hypothetical protein
MADLADELLRDLEGDEDGDGGWNEEEEAACGQRRSWMQTTLRRCSSRISRTCPAWHAWLEARLSEKSSRSVAKSID